MCPRLKAKPLILETIEPLVASTVAFIAVSTLESRSTHQHQEYFRTIDDLENLNLAIRSNCALHYINCSYINKYLIIIIIIKFIINIIIKLVYYFFFIS